MGLGLLLIPALGGYWLLTHLYFTRYGAFRDSGYHIVFRAAITGGVLFVTARLIVVLLNYHIPSVGILWKSFIPIDYSGTLALSSLLGVALPFLINLLCDEEKATQRAAREIGNLIELVVTESLSRQMLVELSLKSGKSYIGFVLKQGLSRHGESDIALIPVASGYRNRKWL